MDKRKLPAYVAAIDSGVWALWESSHGAFGSAITCVVLGMIVLATVTEWGAYIPRKAMYALLALPLLIIVIGTPWAVWDIAGYDNGLLYRSAYIVYMLAGLGVWVALTFVYVRSTRRS